MTMGQNTPEAAKLLGFSYSSFSDLFGFMGHRLQSRLLLLHMESCTAPTRYGDNPHSLLGMPQGPISPEINPVLLFGLNTSPPTSAGPTSPGSLLVTSPMCCPSAHIQVFPPEDSVSMPGALITGFISNLFFSPISAPLIYFTKVRFQCYNTNMASPNEKKRYRSSTATRYASNTRSLPASADTSIKSVDCGR